ncbi:hypothetical protein ACIQAS_11965 [Bacillus safensis]|uniref:hypothetical protein n=1 Tax=Bacillus safensis TaxID=561879 RepID=UPI00382D017E
MKYRKTYHNEEFVFAQLDEVNAGYPAYVKLIEIRMKRLLKIADLNPSLSQKKEASHKFSELMRNLL